MKLSKMTTEQATNAMCMMAEPIGRIGQDEEFQPLLLEIGTAYKTNKIMAGSLGIAKAIPFLLKKHEADTMTIVAAMTGKAPADVKKQNIMVTISAIRDFFDKDFLEVFTSPATSEQSE